MWLRSPSRRLLWGTGLDKSIASTGLTAELEWTVWKQLAVSLGSWNYMAVKLLTHNGLTNRTYFWKVLSIGRYLTTLYVCSTV
jgi:hypothetical protein